MFSDTNTMKSMKHNILNILLLYTLVVSVAKYSFTQDNTRPLGSGLEIHLLIDCSKSVWRPGDPKELKKCLAEILKQVTMNLRSINYDGDCVAIYFFSDIILKVKELTPVGYLSWKREDIWKFLETTLINSDLPKANNLNLEYSNFRYALNEVYNCIKQSSDISEVNQVKILIIISDGINDPQNKIPFNYDEILLEEAPLLESTAIAYKLSEFRNFLKTEICMVQLPYNRPDADHLSYAHAASWDSLLDGYRFTANKLESIEHIISDAFLKIRSIVFKDIYIKTNYLKYDKRNQIAGEFDFITPQLSINKIEITIKLTSIYDEQERLIPIEDVTLSGEQKKNLLVIDNIYSNQTNKIKVAFKLPENILMKYNSIKFVTLDIAPKYINTSKGKEYLAFSFINDCKLPNNRFKNQKRK